MALHAEGRVVVRGGADLIKCRPVFSIDSKYVFVCSGYFVKVFSTSSGQCVRELKGHDGEVTGVIINPQNRLQIYTSSLDGTIKQWDFKDAVLLKTFYVRSPIHGLFAHKDISAALLATIFDDQSCTSKKSQLKLVQITLPKQTGQCVDVNDRFLIESVQAGDKAVAIGTRGEFIAAINGNILKILFMKDMHLKKLSPEKKSLTCVACHPFEYCIATGDETGRISIWHNFHKKELCTVEHWHSLRVEDLCYSPEGSSLFSVGHECTVVEWQHDSSRKKFLPRQGAPICHISCSTNNQLRALSLMTNAILIQAHQKTSQTIQGLVHTNFNQHRKGYMPTGLVIDPHTKALVTNGMVGQLQFYQLQEDCLLFSVDITGENYISPADLHKPLMHTEVEKVAFDHTGHWMATLERREDKKTALELRLKFWEFDNQKQSFKLNTIISEPHSDRVNCLSFRPLLSLSHVSYGPTAVTASQDGKFKLWTLDDDSDSQRKGRSWGCFSVGFFWDEVPRCACFSSDGSLLAVAFGHVVTIWDPDLNVLKKTLCHGPKDQPITHVAFGHGSSAHCLMSASSSILNVWNLLTCNVMWRASMDIIVLVADTESEFVAVFDKQGNLFVFHPLEHKLVYSNQNLPVSKIVDAVFIPRTQAAPSSVNGCSLLPWESHSHLYFMTKCQLLLTVTGEVEKSGALSRIGHVDLEERLPLTPFAMLLNNQQHIVMKEEQEFRMQNLPASANMREMLHSSAHTLPRVKSLCTMFVQAVLNPGTDDVNRRKSTESDESEDDNNANSDCEEPDNEESDMETQTPAASYRENMKEIDRCEDSIQNTRNQDDQEKLETDYPILSKVSRSGLKWIRKIFHETY